MGNQTVLFSTRPSLVVAAAAAAFRFLREWMFCEMWLDTLCHCCFECLVVVGSIGLHLCFWLILVSPVHFCKWVKYPRILCVLTCIQWFRTGNVALHQQYPRANALHVAFRTPSTLR